ncbi:hypothetical protein ABT275_27280 [Streptomyces sp. NPDC001185]|uniref:hypothetical protein n=1 Tax=Streptomyces sp. NPDC001185 TaxID=3154380 RepID=UPI003327321C
MYTTGRGSTSVALTLSTALLLAITGCSSSGAGKAHGHSRTGRADGGSKVLQGLGNVATSARKNMVNYVDATEARRLSRGAPDRFAFVRGPVSSLLSSYSPPPWGHSLAARQIDTAVDFQGAGHWEGAFDQPAIATSLQSHGYTKTKRDGRDVWTSSQHPDQAYEIAKDTVSYSTRSGVGLSALHPEDGHTLADIEEYRRAAECVGDAYRVDFSAMRSSGPVRLSALGQRATVPAKNTEAMCFVIKDAATAERTASRLRAIVAKEAPTYDGTKVTVDKSGDLAVVRAIVPDTTKQMPGRLNLTDMALWAAVEI